MADSTVQAPSIPQQQTGIDGYKSGPQYFQDPARSYYRPPRRYDAFVPIPDNWNPLQYNNRRRGGGRRGGRNGNRNNNNNSNTNPKSKVHWDYEEDGYYDDCEGQEYGRGRSRPRNRSQSLPRSNSYEPRQRSQSRDPYSRRRSKSGGRGNNTNNNNSNNSNNNNNKKEKNVENTGGDQRNFSIGDSRYNIAYDYNLSNLQVVVGFRRVKGTTKGVMNYENIKANDIQAKLSNSIIPKHQRLSYSLTTLKDGKEIKQHVLIAKGSPDISIPANSMPMSDTSKMFAHASKKLFNSDEFEDGRFWNQDARDFNADYTTTVKQLLNEYRKQLEPEFVMGVSFPDLHKLYDVHETATGTDQEKQEAFKKAIFDNHIKPHLRVNIKNTLTELNNAIQDLKKDMTVSYRAPVPLTFDNTLPGPKVTIPVDETKQAAVYFQEKDGSFVGAGGIVSVNIKGNTVNTIMTAKHVYEGASRVVILPKLLHRVIDVVEFKPILIKDNQDKDVTFLTSPLLDTLVSEQKVKPIPLGVYDPDCKSMCYTVAYNWHSVEDAKICNVFANIYVFGMQASGNVDSPVWFGKSGSVIYQDGVAIGVVSLIGCDANGFSDFSKTGVVYFSKDQIWTGMEWCASRQVSFKNMASFSVKRPHSPDIPEPTISVYVDPKTGVSYQVHDDDTDNDTSSSSSFSDSSDSDSICSLSNFDSPSDNPYPLLDPPPTSTTPIIFRTRICDCDYCKNRTVYEADSDKEDLPFEIEVPIDDIEPITEAQSVPSVSTRAPPRPYIPSTSTLCILLLILSPLCFAQTTDIAIPGTLDFSPTPYQPVYELIGFSDQYITKPQLPGYELPFMAKATYGSVADPNIVDSTATKSRLGSLIPLKSHSVVSSGVLNTSVCLQTIAPFILDNKLEFVADWARKEQMEFLCDLYNSSYGSLNISFNTFLQHLIKYNNLAIAGGWYVSSITNSSDLLSANLGFSDPGYVVYPDGSVCVIGTRVDCPDSLLSRIKRFGVPLNFPLRLENPPNSPESLAQIPPYTQSPTILATTTIESTTVTTTTQSTTTTLPPGTCHCLNLDPTSKIKFLCARYWQEKPFNNTLGQVFILSPFTNGICFWQHPSKFNYSAVSFEHCIPEFDLYFPIDRNWVYQNANFTFSTANCYNTSCTHGSRYNGAECGVADPGKSWFSSAYYGDPYEPGTYFIKRRTQEWLVTGNCSYTGGRNLEPGGLCPTNGAIYQELLNCGSTSVYNLSYPSYSFIGRRLPERYRFLPKYHSHFIIPPTPLTLYCTGYWSMQIANLIPLPGLSYPRCTFFDTFSPPANSIFPSYELKCPTFTYPMIYTHDTLTTNLVKNCTNNCTDISFCSINYDEEPNSVCYSLANRTLVNRTGGSLSYPLCENDRPHARRRRQASFGAGNTVPFREYLPVNSLLRPNLTCRINGTFKECEGYLHSVGNPEIVNQVFFYNDSLDFTVHVYFTGFPAAYIDPEVFKVNGSVGTKFYYSGTVVDNGYLFGSSLTVAVGSETGLIDYRASVSTGPFYCVYFNSGQVQISRNTSEKCTFSSYGSEGKPPKTPLPYPTPFYIGRMTVFCRSNEFIEYYLLRDNTLHNVTCINRSSSFYYQVNDWVTIGRSVGLFTFEHSPIQLKLLPATHFGIYTKTLKVAKCYLRVKIGAEGLLQCQRLVAPPLGSELFVVFRSYELEFFSIGTFHPKPIIHNGNYVPHYQNDTNSSWCFSLPYSDYHNKTYYTHFLHYIKTPSNDLTYYIPEDCFYNHTSNKAKQYRFFGQNLSFPIESEIVQVLSFLSPDYRLYCTNLTMNVTIDSNYTEFTISLDHPHRIHIRSVDNLSGNATESAAPIVVGEGVLVINLQETCPSGDCTVYALIGDSTEPFIYQLYWNQCPQWKLLDDVGFGQYNHYANYVCKHKSVAAAVLAGVAFVIIISILIFLILFIKFAVWRIFLYPFKLFARCCYIRKLNKTDIEKEACNRFKILINESDSEKRDVEKEKEKDRGKKKRNRRKNKRRDSGSEDDCCEPVVDGVRNAAFQHSENQNFKPPVPRNPIVIGFLFLILFCTTAHSLTFQFQSITVKNGTVYTSSVLNIQQPLHKNDYFKHVLWPEVKGTAIMPKTLVITVKDIICSYHTELKYFTFDAPTTCTVSVECCGDITCDAKTSHSHIEQRGVYVYYFGDVFQCVWGGASCFCCTGNSACITCAYYPNLDFKNKRSYALTAGLTKTGGAVTFSICLDSACEVVTVGLFTEVNVKAFNLSLTISALTGMACDYHGDYVIYGNDIYDISPPGYAMGRAGSYGDVAAKGLDKFPGTTIFKDFWVAERLIPSKPTSTHSGDIKYTDLSSGFKTFVKNVEAKKLVPVSTLYRGRTIVDRNDSLVAVVRQLDVPVESVSIQVSMPNIVFEVLHEYMHFYSLALSVFMESCYECSKPAVLFLNYTAKALGSVYVRCDPDVCLFNKIEIVELAAMMSLNIIPTLKYMKLCLHFQSTGVSVACTEVVSTDPVPYIVPVALYNSMSAPKGVHDADFSVFLQFLSWIEDTFGLAGTIIFYIISSIVICCLVYYLLKLCSCFSRNYNTGRYHYVKCVINPVKLA